MTLHVDENLLNFLQRHAVMHGTPHFRGEAMSTTMQSLGIDRLSVEQKLTLVREIWDDIAMSGTRTGLSERQLQELRHRVLEDDANPEATAPWEQVKTQALGQITK